MEGPFTEQLILVTQRMDLPRYSPNGKLQDVVRLNVVTRKSTTIFQFLPGEVPGEDETQTTPYQVPAWHHSDQRLDIGNRVAGLNI